MQVYKEIQSSHVSKSRCDPDKNYNKYTITERAKLEKNTM